MGKTIPLVLVCALLVVAGPSPCAESIFDEAEPDEKAEAARQAWIRSSIYAARYDRLTALKLGGGSPEGQWAVLNALRWLKMHQNSDGSWGEAPVQPALTGFALLCFLGFGADHVSPEFGATVRAAIDWFVRQQDEDGYFEK
jgi:hypothetical protein